MSPTITEPSASSTATNRRPRTTPADHRLGFQSLDDERTIDDLPVTGELPAWLAGTLLRTGPARFEIGDRGLAHWFDGQAMLHRFGFADGRVGYANRFLRGRAFEQAQRTGKLSYSEFATDPCRSLFKRIATTFSPSSGLSDNGNVNVARLEDEFIAMTETPMPVAFDPHTLRSAGVAYRPPGHLTTAHPHHDPRSGELVNFAAQLGPVSSYRFFAQRGRAKQRLIASATVRNPSYVHSFGMTERHLVLAEFPLIVNPTRLALSGRPYIENYRWRPQRGTRFLVFDRRTGELRRRFVTDACFGFHHVNAFDDGDQLVADIVTYADDEIIRALYLDRLRSPNAELPTPTLTRFRLDMLNGAVSSEVPVATPIELPRIDYRRRHTQPYRYVYGVGTTAESTDGRWLDRIVKLDLDAREPRQWQRDGCYPGEPVFAADPDADREDDGVLLSVVLDPRRERSFLLVLDARDLSERARAEVPHHIPFGFHGQYFGALH